MNFKNGALLLLLGISSSLCIAQEEEKVKEKKNVYCGFDVGYGSTESYTKDLNYVRAKNTTYSSSYRSSSSFSTSESIVYSGFRTELHSKNKLFAFSTGIRFFVSKSSLGGNDNSYFYFINNESETTSSFYRVSSIEQRVYCLGIPVEGRLILFDQRFVKLYFKLGLAMYKTIYTDNKVHFQNNSMKSYENEILTKIEKVEPFIFTASTGPGISFGKPGNTLYNLELGVPCLISNASSIVNIESGIGATITASVLIPLK